MTLNLSVYVITTKILLVACAPKLQYVLFEPLTYEAKAGPFSARKASSSVEATATNTPTDHETANLILSDSSEEFLENDRNSTEHIQNNTSTTPLDVTTTQETSKKVETPAPALRSKSCFSCIGSLRTGDSVPIPLKSLPVYLRDNENQKGYPKFGYEFDEAICKLVSNRILCGYNKNTGTIANSKEAVHVDANCKIRGDRIECGYGNTGGGGGKGAKRALKLEMPVNDKIATTFKLKDILYSDIIKLQLPVTDETATIFELKDILQEVTTKTEPVEATKLAKVQEESVTEEVIGSTLEPSKGIINSTKAANVSEEPTTTTTSTTPTTTTTAISTTETTSTTTTTETTSTAETTTETEASSKTSFLSLRSIMKMQEDMEKMARQGRDSETTEYVPAVTRCVEIGDRIVCYDFKPKPTTASQAATSTTSPS